MKPGRMELSRREARFNVAQDARRPFDVLGNGTTVRAVGTEFSVRAREASENDGSVKDKPPAPRENAPSGAKAAEKAANDIVNRAWRGEISILINGHKASPAEAKAIPMSAIERIEVLPKGASAPDGSIAPKGFVNFVLR